MAAFGAGVPLNKFVAEALEEALPEGPKVGKVQTKPKRGGVPSVREDGGVRVEGRGIDPATGIEGGVRPQAGICVNCDHPKVKHGGFKGACQSENCLCGGFE